MLCNLQLGPATDIPHVRNTCTLIFNDVLLIDPHAHKLTRLPIQAPDLQTHKMAMALDELDAPTRHTGMSVWKFLPKVGAFALPGPITCLSSGAFRYEKALHN